MINISCSKLELVRKNPFAYVESLTGNYKAISGSHGMFAYWKDKVQSVHKNQLKFSESLKSLKEVFGSRFTINSANTKKQQLLLQQYINYFSNFDSLEFAFLEARKNLKWSIVPNSYLTGHTPAIARSKEKYFAYYFQEQNSQWENELRFPLIQKYLVESQFKCNMTEVEVGIYCLEDNRFHFKNYSEKDIEVSFNEAEMIFNTVIDEINKK